VKHIAHLLNTSNIIVNQNKCANEIVPEATTPLEYSVLGKLGLGSEELETLIESTKEGMEAAQAILKKNNHFSTFGKSNISFPFKIPTSSLDKNLKETTFSAGKISPITPTSVSARP
jgi:hypothetical protein